MNSCLTRPSFSCGERVRPTLKAQIFTERITERRWQSAQWFALRLFCCVRTQAVHHVDCNCTDNSIFLLERPVFKIYFLSSLCLNVVTLGGKIIKQSSAFNCDKLCVKLKQVLFKGDEN